MTSLVKYEHITPDEFDGGQCSLLSPSKTKHFSHLFFEAVIV